MRTGRGRVFRNAELAPDVLLASGCLPSLFQAVEINGESYWDGGFAGNPTLTPLVRECSSNDIILVQVNPIERPETPRTAREIIKLTQERTGQESGWATLRPIAYSEYPHVAARPLNTVMDNGKFYAAFGIWMSSWEDQLRAFLREWAAGQSVSAG